MHWTWVIIVTVVGVVLVAQGWIIRLWLHRLSTQLATLTLAVREVADRLAAIDEDLQAIEDEGVDRS